MKLLFSLLLLLGSAPTLLAQTTTRPKPTASKPAPVTLSAEQQAQVETRANALTANMQKALGLNPQQVERVRQINLISVRGVETSRLTYRQDVRKMAAVVDDIGQSRLAMLKEVLSPDQFNRYQRKREEKMGVPSGQAAQGNAAPGYGE